MINIGKTDPERYNLQEQDNKNAGPSRAIPENSVQGVFDPRACASGAVTKKLKTKLIEGTSSNRHSNRWRGEDWRGGR